MHVPRTISRARHRLERAVRPAVEVGPAPVDGVVVDWDVPVPVRDGTVLRVNVFRRSAPGRGWVASTEDSDAPMSTPRRTQWLRPGPFPERLLCP